MNTIDTHARNIVNTLKADPITARLMAEIKAGDDRGRRIILKANIQHQIRMALYREMANEHAQEFRFAMGQVGLRGTIRSGNIVVFFEKGEEIGHVAFNWDGTMDGIFRAGLKSPITFDPNWLSAGARDAYHSAVRKYLKGEDCIEGLSERLYRHAHIFVEVQAAVYSDLGTDLDTAE